MGGDGEFLRRKLRRGRRVRRGLMVLCVLAVLLCGGSYVFRASYRLGDVPKAYSGASGVDSSGIAVGIERDESFLVLYRGWIVARRYTIMTSRTAFNEWVSESVQWNSLESAFGGTGDLEGLVRPGVGANVVFAVPLWPFGVVGLGALPWLIARDRRLSRVGHCLRCGYDVRSLAASSVCPECGCADRV